MGNVTWTPDQKQVIDLRDCNILVSAAAGSGKTAVLVERIMSRILDPYHPVNIDEFLIVTFTNAAAAEMRGRIGKAIETAVEQQPDNTHLRKQMTLLHNAQISTIHSFCSYVIQNYFHRTDISPEYRLANDAEIKLLQSDVLEKILEGRYESATPEFLELANCYMFDRQDDAMEEMVLGLYSFAMSFAYPDEWLSQMKAGLSHDTLDEFCGAKIIQDIMTYLDRILREVVFTYEKLIEVCEQEDGPDKFIPRLEEELQTVQYVISKETFDERVDAIRLFTPGRIPTQKAGTADENLINFVKTARDGLKETMKSLRENYLFQKMQGTFEDYRLMAPKILEIIDITIEFKEKFSQAKKERGLADFDDLEQYAIEILCKNGEQTEAAYELADHFREIMIDEYQDSNDVQETILRSVSRENRGEPNLFRVGDIKQSIYRFRLAKPELFLEKLHTYSKENGPCRLVNLKKNFRSRQSVLKFVNDIFKELMKPDIGGVMYNEDARLNPGATFPKDKNAKVSDEVEILMCDGADPDHSKEARMIGERILELVNGDTGMRVYDHDIYRPAKFGDIVILARSAKGYLDAIEKQLNSMGIPTTMERRSGFYQTYEITVMVNLFLVLDNPRQDIPLVATLRSPMFSFSDEELATIAGKRIENDFYDCLLLYKKEDDLGNKIKNFMEFLDEMRSRLPFDKVVDIIYAVYEKTGIDDYFRTMPEGQQRMANLDLLEKEAQDFDGTSFHGLSQFVRFLQKIMDNEMDSGEANIFGESADVVRLMTIHKSKGLEFPICFVAGCHRKLQSGNKDFLSIHSTLGVASEAIDNDKRIRRKTLFQQFINDKNHEEEMGEEFRILYVALTRAKEKLILSGMAVPTCEKKMSDWQSRQYSYVERVKETSYFDCMMPAILQKRLRVQIRIEEKDQRECEEIKGQFIAGINRTNFDNFNTEQVYHDKINEYYKFLDSFEYEGVETDIPVKVSVSELKKQSMEDLESKDLFVLKESDEEQAPVPNFIETREEKQIPGAGAMYGTIWHQAMATLVFESVVSKEVLPDLISALVEDGKLLADQKDVLKTEGLWKFFDSDLGHRMTEASKRGDLFREQPFVLGVPAKDIYPEKESTEMVLIQGIIDGFFFDGDEIVLMDYKTDHINENQEEVLVERYRTQLDLYKRALESILGKKVKEVWIYSFCLNQSIRL